MNDYKQVHLSVLYFPQLFYNKLKQEKQERKTL